MAGFVEYPSPLDTGICDICASLVLIRRQRSQCRPLAVRIRAALDEY